MTTPDEADDEALLADLRRLFTVADPIPTERARIAPPTAEPAPGNDAEPRGPFLRDGSRRPGPLPPP
ncbi:hypothetical protein Dvina_10310 [Dactylosporangium vinaceum]|uniref:Uncharacterized protein n=1 Tax=Dactylosporangium vinaceum TaxID=53362 RepID=A0ABV5MBG5_9ACTN|nr:hypothetical protein [Dactylosporangium vinaceum]UAB98442.1 hypothetical protein Dvina_10310 [Dactylosporangium vinaceum]